MLVNSLTMPGTLVSAEQMGAIVDILFMSFSQQLHEFSGYYPIHYPHFNGEALSGEGTCLRSLRL